MRRLIFFIACLLLGLQSSFGQRDFRDGYLVIRPGDTTFLKIDYRSDAKNYVQCYAQDAAGVKGYSAADILGYGFVNDKHYESGIAQGGFVEVLVRGKLSLYRHGSGFYLKKDEAVHYIEEKKTKLEAGTRLDTRWKGILSMLVADCIPAPHNELAKVTFGDRRIADFVIRYNTCAGFPSTVYRSKTPWIKVGGGVVAGVTRSTLVLEDHHVSYLKGRYHSVYPSVGLALNVTTTRGSNRLALQPEIHFSRARYSSAHVEELSYRTTYEDTYITLTTLSIPVVLGYSIVPRKYILRIDGGFNFDVQMRSDTRVIREDVADGFVDTFEYPAFEIYKSQFGYVAGVGVMRRFPAVKASLVLRYAALDDVSRPPAPRVHNRKLALALILQMK